MPTTPDYGFATVTFTNQIETHDVKLPFTFAVNVDDLDASELAWEAAGVWPEAGWDSDKPVWGATDVTVTIDGNTTVLL